MVSVHWVTDWCPYSACRDPFESPWPMGRRKKKKNNKKKKKKGRTNKNYTVARDPKQQV